MGRDLNELQERIGEDRIQQSMKTMNDFTKASKDLAMEIAAKGDKMTEAESKFIETFMIHLLDHLSLTSKYNK